MYLKMTIRVALFKMISDGNTLLLTCGSEHLKKKKMLSSFYLDVVLESLIMLCAVLLTANILWQRDCTAQGLHE